MINHHRTLRSTHPFLRLVADSRHELGRISGAGSGGWVRSEPMCKRRVRSGRQRPKEDVRVLLRLGRPRCVSWHVSSGRE